MYSPMLDLVRATLEICPEQAPIWPRETECAAVTSVARRLICCLGRSLVRLGERLERLGAVAPISLPQGR